MSEQNDKELLLFQLGPVQEFIAQAETVGDLRAGSELLSELTAAALKVVPGYETEAVFPAVKKEELKGIPNRFLAFVPKGEGENIGKSAANEAKAELLRIAEACWSKLIEVPPNRKDAFMKQVEAFLQTTWAVLKNPTGNMGVNYKTIGKLMAMRRNIRQFDAWHEESTGAVKDFLSGKEAALDVADNKSPNKNSGRGAMNLIKKALTGPIDEDVKERLGKYIAVIAMDGDHMGEQLSGFTGKDEHRRFSEKLAGFAKSVEISSGDGALIYAGGDDVLAVVKATRAIDIAHKLARQFKDAIQADGVSASAGIAIGSAKAPLQDLIHEAHAAEARAKHVYGRDALAVSVLKRSGEILKWGCKWNSKAFEIYGRLSAESGKFSRFAYKLAGFLMPYELSRPLTNDWDDQKKIILAETLHTLKQTEDVEGVLSPELLEDYLGEELIKAHPEDFLGLFLCEAFINRPRE